MLTALNNIKSSEFYDLHQWDEIQLRSLADSVKYRELREKAISMDRTGFCEANL